MTKELEEKIVELEQESIELQNEISELDSYTRNLQTYLRELEKTRSSNNFYWFTAKKGPFVADVSYTNKDKRLYGFKQTPDYNFIEHYYLRFITHATLDELIEQFR